MKRCFLLAFLLSFSLIFVAKEVSYDEAMSRANAFFSNSSASSSTGKKKVKSSGSNLSLALTVPQMTADKKPAFYVINNNGGGFVIVSADDNAKTILASSQDGYFEPNDIPEHVMFWLNHYASEITEIAQSDDAQFVPQSNEKSVTATATYTKIEPLLGNIEHNQSKPYNDSCPLLSGTRTVTGCVATAAGQIMTKYKHPAKGTGTVSYTWKEQTLSADFSKSTYDWANVLDKYTTSNYNTAQGRAIASLVRDIGYGAKMNYNIASNGGSGATDYAMAKAFVNNFGYDKSLRRVQFNATYEKDNVTEKMIWYPQEYIMEDIYAELQAGRPLFITGQSSGGGGHAFVCDRIQEDGKLHINWGWAGLANGYYELTAFKPSGTGIGAGSGNYVEDVAFLMSIKPDEGATSSPISFGVRNQTYDPTSNEFDRSGTTRTCFLKTTTTSNTDVVYPGYDYFNLGYVKIESMGFGYNLSKNNTAVKNVAAPWYVGNTNYETYSGISWGLGSSSFSGKGYSITPKISVSNLVQDVANGVYDFEMSIQDREVGIFYSVYVWNRGKVKNKIAVGKSKVYVYPASESNYNRTNNPTNLKATKNESTYTLSWSGTASNYILFTWDDDDLTVEKLSAKTKSGVSAGKNWAVFAYETQGDIAYAISEIMYGEKLSATGGDDPDPQPDPEPQPQPQQTINIDEWFLNACPRSKP